MSVGEAINRGNNLFITGVLALAGAAFAPEFFIEDHPQYKADDGLLFGIGVIALVWYLRGKNRFTRSVVPVILMILAFVVKFGAVMVEMKDKDDVGDDFGGFTLFLLAMIATLVIYKTSHKLTAK